ncbi:MAG: ribonuclease T2 [Bryobacteraceae bacterium]
MLRTLLALTLLTLLILSCTAAPPDARNEPGKFDYYVLSLSWSPQFCNGEAGQRSSSDLQCAQGRQFGFVAHGLWPQYERGYPEECTTAPPPSRAIIDKMLDIMPAPGLIRHEWSKHGTCDGTTAATYFGKVRAAYAKVQIPNDYKQPLRQVMVAPQDLKAKLVQANGPASAKSFAILCGGNGGRFLSEVRVCFDRNLGYRACSTEVRDQCRVPQMIMPPVR